MAVATYIPLKTTTVSVATPTVTLNGFSASYKHLIVQIKAASSRSSLDYFTMTFNGDTATNYSYAGYQGNGTAATSGGAGTQSSIAFIGNFPGTNSSTSLGFSEVRIYDYNSTHDKAVMIISGSRNSATNGTVDVTAGTWRKSPAEAITSISIQSGTGNNIAAGSEITLFGIASIDSIATPKASGGVIYSDSTYWYHVFSSTGIFTPNQSLTAQIMAVGGGGGGGGNIGAGGGAGAMTTFATPSSLTSGVSYTCTVAAGAAGGTGSADGAQGNPSSFAGSGFTTITALGGGKGPQSSTGYTGGSGSGGGPGQTGGGASGPNTNIGGNGYYVYPVYSAGGGGGATSAGSNGTTGSAYGGNGGVGYLTTSLGLDTIFGKPFYMAAGGGGSGVRPDGSTQPQGGGTSNGGGNGGYSTTNATSATTYGSGGGGGTWTNFASGNGGNGAAGIVIVRYAK